MSPLFRALLFLCLPLTLLHADTAPVPLADGFDLPVGHGDSKGYYKARGYQPNGHLGEDWNGSKGGDTDLGDPVYVTAHGLVLFARDYHLGWGNVIIVRHAYLEAGETHFVDSLYGHLDQIMVAEGATVKRGQQIGTIGTAHGMYEAHLHFEMRKNLAIGMNRSAFPRDFSCYWDPTSFVEQHRVLSGAGQLVAAPVNTFDKPAPPLYAGPVSAPVQVTATAASSLSPAPRLPTMKEAAVRNGAGARGPFFVDRYSDMRSR